MTPPPLPFLVVILHCLELVDLSKLHLVGVQRLVAAKQSFLLLQTPSQFLKCE